MLEEKVEVLDEAKAYRDYLLGKTYRCGHSKVPNMTFCVTCDGQSEQTDVNVNGRHYEGVQSQ